MRRRRTRSCRPAAWTPRPGASRRRASTRWRRGWSTSIRAPERARRRLLQQQLHLQRHPRPTTSTSSTCGVDHNAGGGSDTVLRALQLSSRPTASSRRCSNDPVASGDFASDYPHPRPERRRRLVAHLRQRAVQRVPRRLQPRPLRHGAPGVRHRRQRRVRHQRRAEGSALLRRPAAHADRRASRGIGGPFFRPQFQTSQVFQFAENLTWTKGSALDEVRRRAPARPGRLHRPALAERRAELHRRPLHRTSASATSCSGCRACSG